MSIRDTLQQPDRRNFIKHTASITAAAATLFSLPKSVFSKEQAASERKFPSLPYPENGLAPYISEKTLNLHYNQHFRHFFDQVTLRSKGTPYANASLEKIIQDTYGGITMEETLHLMATLTWNHDFYWKSMKPQGGGDPGPKLKDALVKTWGSVREFKLQFKAAAMTLESGWAWLVIDSGIPKVTFTSYHKTPLLLKETPLITLDCWEHAYYLDYQNRKDEYVDAYLTHCVNWDFAEKNFERAVAKGTAESSKSKK